MGKWNNRFLDLCDHVSTWSHDPSTKVGAVVVNDNNIVIGMGYNGFPRGFSNQQATWNDKSFKNKLVVHAEANAILNANSSVKGCTLYTNFFTCSECAKIIIQSGIKKVVSYTPVVSSSWSESFKLAKEMYKSVGIEVVVYDR